ncbi:gas vesicle protein GvpJ [Sinomonas sp.]|uniref:gas vesicle protein GvpJ n=1 Tax=Sinomonas sp. TaxID=1914986 RepID=UPI003F7DD297
MSVTPSGGYLDRPHSSSLADVLNVILDKGLVIDAYVGVSLLGVQLLAIDARIVVASVDTYLRYAEATNRLNLQASRGVTLPDLVQTGYEKTVETVAHKVAKDKTEDAVQTVKEVATSIKDTFKEAVFGPTQDEG